MSISRHQAGGAYRRWEPQAFGEPAAAAADDIPLPEQEPAALPEPEPLPPPTPEIEPRPQFQLPTAAEIEAMFEDARREGYETGFQEGSDAARQQAQRMSGLVDELDDSLKRLDHDIAEEVVGLAVEIARQMVRRSLAVSPEAVTETVRSALNQLPQAQVRIHVHPEDAALVREYLGDQPGALPHLVIEDESITRGGCRLHGNTSEIDATVETRWRRILEGLGREASAWQEGT